MKKVVAALMMLLLLSTSFCFAENSIDLKNYSDEELKSLYFSVKEEMSDRGIGRIGDLYDGVYIVGTDIAPGMYKITAPESAYFYVFWSMDNYNDYIDLKSREAIIIDGKLITEDYVYKLELKEGYVVLVTYNYLRLEEMDDELDQ